MLVMCSAWISVAIMCDPPGYKTIAEASHIKSVKTGFIFGNYGDEKGRAQ